MRTFDEDAFVVYQVGGREGGKLFYTAEVPPEVRGRAVAEGSLAEWAQSIIALDAAVFGPFDEIARAQRRVLAQPVVRALWQGDAGLFGLGPRATGRSRDAALVLRRDWGGICHEVVVAETGFRWQGQVYPSLSQVARAITGTRWNGPRFFGLTATGTKGKAG